jgi:hypothetical protein
VYFAGAVSVSLVAANGATTTNVVAYSHTGLDVM